MWPTPVSPPRQARGMLQNRVLLWKEQSEASRSPSRAHSPGLLGPVLGPPYPSGRLTPTRLDMVRPWVPPPPFAPPLAPPPLFAPPPAPRPSAGPWGLRPSAWSLLPRVTYFDLSSIVWNLSSENVLRTSAWCYILPAFSCCAMYLLPL